MLKQRENPGAGGSAHGVSEGFVLERDTSESIAHTSKIQASVAGGGHVPCRRNWRTI
jgi:hypothetical protein